MIFLSFTMFDFEKLLCYTVSATQPNINCYYGKTLAKSISLFPYIHNGSGCVATIREYFCMCVSYWGALFIFIGDELMFKNIENKIKFIAILVFILSIFSTIGLFIAFVSI